MQRFRLLAIRPLQHCAQEYIKVLSEGEVYPLCSDFEFIKAQQNDQHSDIVLIKKNEIAHDAHSLYKVGHLSVSLSAIVAKNGFGKSTLTELLFAAIYLFSIENNVLEKQSKSFLDAELQALIKEREEHLVPEKEPAALDDLVAQVKETLEKQDIQGVKDMILKLEEDRHMYYKKTKELDWSISDIEKRLMDYAAMLDKVKVEIFYHIDENCYCLRINANASKPAEIIAVGSNLRAEAFERSRDRELSSTDSKELTEKFFYTIAVSYSHYSMNSNIMGDWIRHLFHKNDGYKTPIVVNPMRTDGGFDINDETVFAKYRLLSNALVQRSLRSDLQVFVSDKQYIESIRFRFNPDKIKDKTGVTYEENAGIGGKDPRQREMVISLMATAFPGKGDKDIYDMNLPFTDEIFKYLRQKVDKIAKTYDEYREGYQYDKKLSREISRDFLEKLLGEDSHIAYKLHQAINFLGNIKNNIKDKEVINWKDPKKDERGEFFEYSLDDLLKWMHFKDAQDIIRHVPPSIFNIEIMLKDTSEQSVKSSTDTLSSGELQLLHSVQSIMYHLLNIESVHKKPESGIKYQYVNIIFDEIELYFHPDYQRKFVHNLLKSLERLAQGELLSNIRGINFIFSTHSPFILSDIVQQNVLLLDIKDNKSVPLPNKIQTFGANIHDLLARDFFMKSFMGEWAKTRIDKIVLILNYWKAKAELERFISSGEGTSARAHLWASEKVLLVAEMEKLEMDIELIDGGFSDYDTAKDIMGLIQIIGEPVIRHKLTAMFDSVFGKDDSYKINRVKELAKELGLTVTDDKE